ncbi:LCP family protein [Paenibacillus bovis]|uniref:Transcriptional regulator n=1 Tax=Paenibacillus bovis TaxID=1616788 RepID=A0A172ZD07_9BACL|nr:LCP family protein [Paenibacillus bovis]ANF95536.1 transcriptional regulator [Paenibacillus bovis]
MNVKTKRTLLWSLGIIAVAIIGYAIYYFTAVYNQIGALQKTGDASPFKNVPTNTVAAAAPPVWTGTEPVNILLMGVDSRNSDDGEIPRSDTMLVASLDPVKKTIHLFSILRDTYVDIPGYGENRINSAITHGPNTAMKTVSDLLGIPVQYYVYTDFQGFIKLVDAVGGIDFKVEKDMHYTSAADKHVYDINLKAGMQHLDGKTALQYVRFRHDATSDFTRTERQRAFLTAVGDKLKSTTSIMKLPDILEQINPYIDTNLSTDDLWKLASVAYDSNMSGSEQLPPNDLLAEKHVGGAAVIGVKSEEKLKQFIQDTLNKNNTDPIPVSADGKNSSSGTGSTNSAGSSTSGSSTSPASISGATSLSGSSSH